MLQRSQLTNTTPASITKVIGKQKCRVDPVIDDGRNWSNKIYDWPSKQKLFWWGKDCSFGKDRNHGNRPTCQKRFWNFPPSKCSFILMCKLFWLVLRRSFFFCGWGEHSNVTCLTSSSSNQPTGRIPLNLPPLPLSFSLSLSLSLFHHPSLSVISHGKSPRRYPMSIMSWGM